MKKLHLICEISICRTSRSLACLGLRRYHLGDHRSTSTLKNGNGPILVLRAGPKPLPLLPRRRVADNRQIPLRYDDRCSMLILANWIYPQPLFKRAFVASHGLSYPLTFLLEKPPLCNQYYLFECKRGNKCPYGHGYILTEAQLEELRMNAKKSPCSDINRGISLPELFTFLLTRSQEHFAYGVIVVYLVSLFSKSSTLEMTGPMKVITAHVAQSVFS